MMRNIVNIVNFLRGCEPREPVDLLEPMRRQMALLERYDLPGTFLLQYDALLDPRFTEPLRAAGDRFELGLWLEMVEPLCAAAGLPWRGRFPWDWHARCGFSVGYLPEERERLVDSAFAKFREVFGAYPKVMGSWTIDAHTLCYTHKTYGLDASCNCKDQVGTDGYTLWGGYYNGAYFPSEQNMFCPAQSSARQLGVPVFRMLGSDPLDQYDDGLGPDGEPAPWQQVITLEPSSARGGGNPAWVDWYFRENFNGCSLAYAYTQAGQENSFGWPQMTVLEPQLEKIAALRAAGRLEAETLGESGRWFSRSFALTPASAMSVQKGERRSLWYNCRNYRANLLLEEGRIRLRDCFLFREDFPERYLQAREDRDVLCFETLPLLGRLPRQREGDPGRLGALRRRGGAADEAKQQAVDRGCPAQAGRSYYSPTHPTTSRTGRPLA
ncbi:MAG: hypothetical protein LBJ11_00985 [Oscillospiraceae bacterium]|jgi:hypothetical protein|nr:hypothetical protein [Oscillospiraceae bacterium]